MQDEGDELVGTDLCFWLEWVGRTGQSVSEKRKEKVNLKIIIGC